MTAPPLPDVPCVRCRVVGLDDTSNDWGTRFYLRYTGSAPTGANCTTLADDIETAFSTHLASLLCPVLSLTEVDVLDIATDTGLSGQFIGNVPGTRTGTAPPIQVAMGIEFDISRRYRGGKPRAFWPFGIDTDFQDQAHWTSSFVAAVNTGIAAFFAQIEALSIGAMGTLQHVNLSYYKGFTNVTNSSGRTRAAPKYRDTALHDDISGYAAKVEVSSQKRRRTATSP